MLSKEYSKLCNKYVDGLFHDFNGFYKFEDAKRNQLEEKGVNVIYGELLFSGLLNIVRNINIKSSDIFLDLGSGIGKTVFQFMLATGVKKCLGVEAFDYRYNQSVKILDIAKQEIPSLFEEREIEFLPDNILDLNFDEATIVYTCSTCFSDYLMNSISNKVKSSKSIRYMMSLRPYDFGMPLYKRVNVDCTWNTAVCYIYAR